MYVLFPCSTRSHSVLKTNRKSHSPTRPECLRRRKSRPSCRMQYADPSPGTLYAKLRTVHHRLLLRIIGTQRKRPEHRMTSYNRALDITGCASIETTLRTRRLLWAGTLLRMSGGRLPKRIVLGNLEGAARRGRGGKDKEWIDCIQSDIQAFGIAGVWKATALKTEVWIETVTKGGRGFMAAWRKEEVDEAKHRQEKRDATRLGNLLSQTGVKNFVKPHPLAQSTSRRYPCTDARPTKTCVAPVDASRDFIYFLRTSSVGGGGGVCCQTFSFVLFSLFSRPRAGLAAV